MNTSNGTEIQVLQNLLQKGFIEKTEIACNFKRETMQIHS
jgi:hypothetical protein